MVVDRELEFLPEFEARGAVENRYFRRPCHMPVKTPALSSNVSAAENRLYSIFAAFIRRSASLDPCLVTISDESDRLVRRNEQITIDADRLRCLPVGCWCLKLSEGQPGRGITPRAAAVRAGPSPIPGPQWSGPR